MGEKRELIPVSNPSNDTVQRILPVLAYQKKRHGKHNPENEAITVILMEEKGMSRNCVRKW